MVADSQDRPVGARSLSFNSSCSLSPHIEATLRSAVMAKKAAKKKVAKKVAKKKTAKKKAAKKK
jgi:hypothetical protein